MSNQHEHDKPTVDPQIFHHILHAIHEEWLALMSLIRFQWPILLLVVAILGALIYIAQPYLPTHVRLAVGQPNSSTDLLGRKYAKIFKEYGINLEVITTAGISEASEMLKAGKVDVAFSLGGLFDDARVSGLVSLGSVEYQPFWLFYRGAEYDGSAPAAFFKGKKFSINSVGSGTRVLAEKILALYGIPMEKNERIASMSVSDSMTALLEGKIDGLFLIQGTDSKNVAKLLADPAIHIFDFKHADAYTKNFKYLEKLVLPRGSMDTKLDIPDADKQLVATTTTILTKENMHSAVQILFLNASKTIDFESVSIFSRPHGFPAHIAKNPPLSSVAANYYEKGGPTLTAYVPFWLAAFLDRIWFLIFALIAVGYPLLKIVPSYRTIYASLCYSDCYYELKRLDKHLHDAKTDAEFEERLNHFDKIEYKINNHIWVPAAAREDFYNLRNALEILRSKTQRMKQEFDSKQAAPSQSKPLLSRWADTRAH